MAFLDATCPKLEYIFLHGIYEGIERLSVSLYARKLYDLQPQATLPTNNLFFQVISQQFQNMIISRNVVYNLQCKYDTYVSIFEVPEK